MRVAFTDTPSNERDVHLTYCTNIHPSDGWEAVLANLERHALPLKARFSPERPFGIGLRLSGDESRTLLEGDRLARFEAFLRERGLYVFTMNGFPHGTFHRQRVKEEVHAPDWRSEERVQYTLRLVEILSALLPDGLDGGISTSPLSYKPWVGAADDATWRQLTENVVRVAERLVRVHEDRGELIHLDIEPEPDGLLENSSEVVAFFRERLLSEGALSLAGRLGVAPDEARNELLEHVRMCFDTCHAAVAFEEPEEVLGRLAEAGIGIGKVQISSALKLDLQNARAEWRDALAPFAESTYLHQVVQRNHDGTLTQYPDLPEALRHLERSDAVEWRVHFHVPVFVDAFDGFRSTQDTILASLAALRGRDLTRHFEIETYTWDVLPGDLKRDLLESIGREYEWVQRVL